VARRSITGEKLPRRSPSAAAPSRTSSAATTHQLLASGTTSAPMASSAGRGSVPGIIT
jgi:hypothetical protein